MILSSRNLSFTAVDMEEETLHIHHANSACGATIVGYCGQSEMIFDLNDDDDDGDGGGIYDDDDAGATKTTTTTTIMVAVVVP